MAVALTAPRIDDVTQAERDIASDLQVARTAMALLPTEETKTFGAASGVMVLVGDTQRLLSGDEALALLAAGRLLPRLVAEIERLHADRTLA